AHEPVSSQGPKTEPDEGEPGRRAEHARSHDEQRRAANGNGERMVEERRQRDAPEDGAEREPSGQRQGEELGLVAHLSHPDEAQGREEYGHASGRHDSVREAHVYLGGASARVRNPIASIVIAICLPTAKPAYVIPKSRRSMVVETCALARVPSTLELSTPSSMRREAVAIMARSRRPRTRSSQRRSSSRSCS